MAKRFVTKVLIEAATGDRIAMPRDIAHHALDVMRLKEGDELELASYDKIWSLRMRGGKLEVLSCQENMRSTPAIEVAISLFKWPRFEWFLEKAVELGVDTIQPILSERCQIKMEAGAWESKVKRLEKIMTQAERQSLALRRCELKSPMPLRDYVHSQKAETCFVAMPGDYPRLLDAYTGQDAVSLISGPEGGFSAQEFSMILECGALPISLGKHILRAETAPLAMLALLRCS
ncbi:MAG: RsmE family RNA methyltransferase [Bradymonadales bacterium]|jgi:16S rRNA (uracil1498-N3)-methyltransferase